MNLESAIVSVDYWKARNAYQEYRALVKSGRAQKGDEELRRAYREITLGRKVLDINLAITTAGCDAHGMPRLAIARAHWAFTFAQWSSNEGPVWFFSRQPGGWRQAEYMRRHAVSVKMTRTGTWSLGESTGKAQVPLIPPAYRPPGSVTGYHLLFEAVWQRAPPVDPFLLRHIGGPFYVVLAQWDLSALEQSVLRARL